MTGAAGTASGLTSAATGLAAGVGVATTGGGGTAGGVGSWAGANGAARSRLAKNVAWRQRARRKRKAWWKGTVMDKFADATLKFGRDGLCRTAQFVKLRPVRWSSVLCPMSLAIFLPDEQTIAAARRWVVPALFVALVLALAVRVAAFFLLPDIDGDAYCYLDKARELRAAILSGSLRVPDLFFFWLPLYPLAVALVSLVFPGGGHLMFVGKLLSAVSGLAACWLVYRLLVTMTRRPLVALAGALAVALDPWQLLYSSNSMTELPFEALVLGALDRRCPPLDGGVRDPGLRGVHPHRGLAAGGAGARGRPPDRTQNQNRAGPAGVGRPGGVAGGFLRGERRRARVFHDPQRLRRRLPRLRTRPRPPHGEMGAVGLLQPAAGSVSAGRAGSVRGRRIARLPVPHPPTRRCRARSPPWRWRSFTCSCWLSSWPRT